MLGLKLPHYVPTPADIPHKAILFWMTLVAIAISWIPLAVFLQWRAAGHEEPRVHVYPDMDWQLYYRPQSENPMFKDGRAMRPRVEHTVARGELYFDDAHYYEGLAVDARGVPLVGVGGGPVYAEALPPQLLTETDDGPAVARETIERGRARYTIFCQVCHGPLGYGDGVIKDRSGGLINPASLHDPLQRSYPIGQLYDRITNGFNTMAPYRDQVPVDDRWAIAAYVRVLQRSQAIEASSLSAEERNALGTQPPPPQPDDDANAAESNNGD